MGKLMAFMLGFLAGVAATLAVMFIAALINWLLAEHDREEPRTPTDIGD